MEPSRSPEPQSAYLGNLGKSEEKKPMLFNLFLGPKLWEKPISLQQFNEDDFFVMNIEEFLAENNLQV